MKIVICDVETTGLDPERCQIIEFGAIILDLESKSFDHRALIQGSFRRLIKRDLWLGEAFALSMNAALLKESIDHGIPEIQVLPDMRKWLHEQGLDTRYPEISAYWMGQAGGRDAFSKSFDSAPPALVGAGKNFGSFDLQFIKKMHYYGQYVKFGHRSIDPGSMFLRAGDEKPPSLDECLKRAGIDKKTNHTAVDDCLLVAELIWTGIKNVDQV